MYGLRASNEAMAKVHYRSVFVSDIHLGAVGAQTEAAKEFLDGVTCDYLYLVGDIVDGWVGRKDRRWTPQHTEVIRVILELANTGCVVRFTPGNHDDFLRRLHGTQIGAIEIEHSFLHTTADDRGMLVVHGDLFDVTCTKYRPVAFVGAWMYEAVTVVNAKINLKRKNKGLSQKNFSAPLKRAVKKFVGKATKFESSISEATREGGFDGVICGHVHRPVIETMDEGFLYVNCGDWVEHCTAVVEHMDGSLELLSFHEVEEPASTEGTWKTLKGLVTSRIKAE